MAKLKVYPTATGSKAKPVGGMDYHSPRKETYKAGNSAEMAPEHWPFPSETHDTSPYQESRIRVEGRRADQQLQRLLEVLQGELINYEGDLPTSSARVEKEIARCISECLADVDRQRKDIPYVQSLLRVYKVVLPHRDGKPTVSLHKVHVILQDNFPDSCLCKLMNILLADWMNTTTKVITFS
jgi:hypothetical protein